MLTTPARHADTATYLKAKRSRAGLAKRRGEGRVALCHFDEVMPHIFLTILDARRA